MSTFGKRLKQLRKEHKLRQEDLAKILFLDKSAISKYENDKNGAENEVLQKLADYFNVSIDYLLGRSDIRNSEELDKKRNLTSKITSDIINELEDSGIEIKEEHIPNIIMAIKIAINKK